MRLTTTKTVALSAARVMRQFDEDKISESKFKSLMYGFSVLLPAIVRKEEMTLLELRIASLEERLRRAEGVKS